VRFLEEEAVWDVVDYGLTHWKSTHDDEDSIAMEEVDEYIGLAKQVLSNARPGSRRRESI